MYKQVKLPKDLFNVTLPSPLDLFSPPIINNKVSFEQGGITGTAESHGAEGFGALPP